MSTMRKLSHIYLLGCRSLERMPPKLSLLHNLRTLTTFVVDTEDGHRIEELKDLWQLGNRLELYNLRKVKCGAKANLHLKQNLNELLLFWGRPNSELDDNPTIDEATSQEQVLESLVPHGELKILEVHGYGGLTISQWMRNPQTFQCLRELIMTNCPGSKDLPIVWLSSSLEHLRLWRMDSLTTLCTNIVVEAEAHNTSLQIFPKLKTMELVDLPELERWAENSVGEINSSVTFPQLEKLDIRNCYKLASLLEMPVLTDLRLDSDKRNNSTGALVSMCMPLGSLPSLVLDIGVPVDVVMPLDGQQSQSQRPLDTLRNLQLEGDDGFLSIFNKSKLQLGLQDCLVSMEELEISSCSNIVLWPMEELRCFPRLRVLGIWGCSKLEGKSSSCEEEEILPLPQLERLIIGYCASLLHIPKLLQLERLDIYSCDSLLHIPNLPASLEVINLQNNRSLVALPSNLGNLAKLRELILRDCHALKALPDGMDGLISLERLSIIRCPRVEKFPQGLLPRLLALRNIYIGGCPELQRRCREGGEYFDLVASIPEKEIEAAQSNFNIKKFVKKLLPPC